MQSRQYPLYLLALVIIIAIVNLLAEVYFWYWRMRWFDMPMHFLGGVWLAGTALWFAYGRKGLEFPRFSKVLAVCLASASGVGLIGEIFQAGLGLENAGYAGGLVGTLKDLFFDTVGGIVVAILLSWRTPQKNK